ncbi:DUF2924 domain-containing protein [Sulfitobacter sp. SK011]|uniref:DUF2924 domain-containing protein n=1 Tax=Sulfitobacter sp. SK011 TaxID=1389004 RepID=UPI0013B38EAF|nr:DUF2924 domain-containing protein [Sulfitobacter sp. SK011]
MTKSAPKPITKLKSATGSRTTKKDQLIKLLGSKSGADIKSLSEKLGWQQHTTRAAMSGLRKAGYEVAAERSPPRAVCQSSASCRYQRSNGPPQQRLQPMGRDPNPERPAVLQKWEAVFGSPPPPYLSVPFMQKAILYEQQCKALGGLSAATRRALKQIAKGYEVTAAAPAKLSTGAHLVREWNGRTYQVHVTEGGFELDGKKWSSLSAIAKHITGATWSGPRFFGLSTRSGAQV